MKGKVLKPFADQYGKLREVGEEVEVNDSLGADLVSKGYLLRKGELARPAPTKQGTLMLPVKESKPVLEKGAHQGVIDRVDTHEWTTKTGQTYTYADVYILESKLGAEVKAGYPATISEKSGLGKLLQRFGASLAVGAEIDVAGVLVGKKCSFVTVNKETDSGTFSNVIRDSLEPAA